MRPTFVTDLRDFLADDDLPVADLPVPALNLVRHLGAIVAWMTGRPTDALELTNVACRRSPRRVRCVGEILAELDDHRKVIAWQCPLCGDNGRITGWEGTYWDRLV